MKGFIDLFCHFHYCISYIEPQRLMYGRFMEDDFHIVLGLYADSTITWSINTQANKKNVSDFHTNPVRLYFSHFCSGNPKLVVYVD